jgi:hypothetical protein
MVCTNITGPTRVDGELHTDEQELDQGCFVE